MFDSNVRKSLIKNGKDVSSAVSSEECIKLADLDFEVEKRSHFIEYLKFSEPDEEGITSSKKTVFKRVPNVFSTVRTDSQIILGTVGNDYEVVQNREMFNFIDGITKFAKFETAGSFNGGREIFVSVKLPETIEIKNTQGDYINEYFLLVSSHDKSRQIDILFTPIRVVCENTMNMALTNSVIARRVSFRHTKNVRDGLTDVQTILKMNGNYIRDFKEQLEVLRLKRITKPDLLQTIALLNLNKDEFTLAKNANFDLRGIEEISTRKINEMNSIYTHVNKASGQQFNQMTGLWLYNGISSYYHNAKNYKTEDDRFDNILYGTIDGKMNQSLKLINQI